jgi:hypothetical protein
MNELGQAGEDIVPKEDGQPFELDESAARSHTPPGWPIETIAIEPSGKAPKRDDPGTKRRERPESGGVRTSASGANMP